MKNISPRRFLGFAMACCCLVALAMLQVLSVRADNREAPPRALFALLGKTTGKKIAIAQAAPNANEPAGRVTVLNVASFKALKHVRKGDTVLLPLAEGETARGVVNLLLREGDWVRVAGALTSERGSFSLGVNVSEKPKKGDAKLGGIIELTARKLAFRLDEEGGAALSRELPLDAVLCAAIPPDRNEPPRAARLGMMVESVAKVPILNSRLSAVAQLYLDFDGEVVTDPNWNNGNTINAASFNLSATDIKAIFARVQEDYRPFNINVTTDVAKYNAAQVGMRMRCIITPTNTAAPGAGGVAYVNSFDKSGSWFSNTIPCWVFNSSVVGISEAVSHEIGHTMGLSHDGRTSPAEEYFQGQGSGATSWAPIMGVGYYVSISQWSKGEYLNANNMEDDVAIIANAANGFGFAPDEAGGTPATAVALSMANTTTPNQTGIITQASDVDFYKFTSPGGPVTLTVNTVSVAPDLDLAIELQDASGTVLAASDPTGPVTATIKKTLVAGQYYLKIRGTGWGDPLDTGYTNYGSLGAYTVTGYLPTGLSIANAAPVLEGDSGSKNATFTVTMSVANTRKVTVKYATSNGTATAGSDYTATSGSLTFAPGETSKTISVPVLGDTLQENNETFKVTLSSPTYSGITTASAVGTILDDDGASLSVDDASVQEEGSGVRNAFVPVHLSAASDQTVTVNYATSDGTATQPDDYTATTGTVSFAPGETLKTIAIPVVGDMVAEPDEYFFVSLNSPVNARIAGAQGTVTITNFDAAVPTPTPTPSGTGLRGEYYDNADLTSLKLSRIDPQVNFNWGTGSPDASIGSDTFSVRWSGQVQPRYSQLYTFSTLSDDGVRVWVDGQLIINSWTDHSATEDSASIYLQAGLKYDLRVEYYENAADAVMQLSWQSASQAKQIIPQSQLYPPPP